MIVELISPENNWLGISATGVGRLDGTAACGTADQALRLPTHA
jgi:hypothetical protein